MKKAFLSLTSWMALELCWSLPRLLGLAGTTWDVWDEHDLRIPACATMALLLYLKRVVILILLLKNSTLSSLNTWPLLLCPDPRTVPGRLGRAVLQALYRRSWDDSSQPSRDVSLSRDGWDKLY